MAIEYTVRFEHGGATITQTPDAATSQETLKPTAAGFVLKSNRLGSSFLTGTGGGSNPALGSGSNPALGSGSNPALGSGGLDVSGVIAILLGACGGAARSGPSMPFQVETQEESDWCWAAVASAVDRYYSPQSFLTQCEVASEVLTDANARQPVNACMDPRDSNRAEALEDALNVIARDGREKNEKLTFQEIQVEIDAGRPVCVCIAWDGGGAHFVVFCGYREWSGGLRTVDVADPFYPDSTQDFVQFPAFYHGGGKVTQTYWTT